MEVSINSTTVNLRMFLTNPFQNKMFNIVRFGRAAYVVCGIACASEFYKYLMRKFQKIFFDREKKIKIRNSTKGWYTLYRAFIYIRIQILLEACLSHEVKFINRILLKGMIKNVSFLVWCFCLHDCIRYVCIIIYEWGFFRGVANIFIEFPLLHSCVIHLCGKEH